MKHKGFVIFLTVLISLLCLYFLSFTVVNRNINEEATAYATRTDGTLDLELKQFYLDSIWKKPVRNYLGIDYTYEEIKKTELGLGLDLQGGMHVTLEVSPIEIIKGLSSNSPNAAFNTALNRATELQRESQSDYLSLFYQAWLEANEEGSLSRIFATATNRERGINSDTPDAEVMDLIRSEVDKANKRALQILRARIDRFGTSQPTIQMVPNSGRIQIELPGVENKERVRSLLQGVAKLEFFEVLTAPELQNGIIAADGILMAEKEEADAASVDAETSAAVADATESLIDEEPGLDELLTDGADSLSDDDGLSELETDSTALDNLEQNYSVLIRYFSADPQSGFGSWYVPIEDTMTVNRVIKRPEIIRLFPPNTELKWAAKAFETEDKEFRLQLYAIRTNRNGSAPLEGDVINRAVLAYDEKGRPAVSMTMNITGTKTWKKLTEKNIKRQIAIVLDDYVFSAPGVQSVIPNGSSQISGSFSIQEAQDLASILEAGALPAPTRIIEEAVVGPSLGKVAQRQGVVSVFAGLAIVILFMVAYYSKGGLIANVALAFNVFFILGILASYSSAITLPGIAGIVLTIGMSIDANVIIFERIREELRNGAGMMAAIRSGYKKAFASIFDANMTTLLVAIILWWLGQGPVKSFAFTLLIGIVCSFFSAVYLTRVVVEFLVRNKGDQSKLSFATPFSKGLLSKVNIDFMGNRKKAYIFSAVFISVGLLCVVLNGGLNFGVDFSGGRSYKVGFTGQEVVPSELKVALADNFDNKGVEVKTYDGSDKLQITTSYLVYDESAQADKNVEQAMIAGIEAYTGMKYSEIDGDETEGTFTILGSTKVGATIADDIKFASYEAIGLALVAIFLYVAFRFRKWQFGIGAIVALAHDSLFVISAFAIFDTIGIKAFEFDSIVIAAILTVIGYSINDTVIVFDRIRETLGLHKTTDNKSNFNLAINNTLSRTVITSVTTLVVILVLLIFGGEVLAGFSFSLLVGVLIGTYSSVFIASPVVIDIPEKEKAKANA